ncbi:MAG: GDSL-type esterase/lipase family protein [Planctomycetaceae bacterium]|jgi:lysophospholipase L1-like esterase|nr:GDSL-type esterase/lipase family protein [Planctomycetaceae bacterium]
MKMKKSLQIVSSFLLTLLLLLPASSLYAQSVALTPVDRKDDWWVKRHADNVARMEKGDINLLMIGDSITHGWDGKGKTVWESYYGHRKPINLGFSGDRTEHVLWRLEHLPLDKISPKTAVLMIGTNNIGHNSSSPKDAADGIKAIVEKLEKQYPALKIIVLNVFPRGNKVDDGNRKKVDEINSYLPELLKDKPNVTLLDINNIFLDAEKNLPKEIMPDFLHPNTYGYELWAKAVEPTLTALLGETNPAIVPVNKLSEEWWSKRHEANSEKIAKGDVEFLMIGDSITQGWDGKDELEKYFAQYKPVNLGFNSDQTQHVLWRLDHLPLDKISPKAAMIMIGTNNTGNPANTPWMIAVGIKAIVEKLQKQKPDLQIIVLKVFPRGEKADDRLRLRVNEINLALPELLADLKNVEIIDINDAFLAEDGTLPKEIMPDFLHPNTKGYELWGEKLAPVLKTKFGR